MSDNNKFDESHLLVCFNAHDEHAFIQVYEQMFMELHSYASRLYHNTYVSPEDAVQDVFCALWENTSTHFDSLLKIKAFLYTALRNRYKSHIEHLKIKEKYKEYVEQESEEFTSQIVENELYVFLRECIEFLPENQSQVMKLYLDGYTPKEIAERLDLNIQTVYNLKSMAIRLLKEKLSRSSF